MYKILRDGNYVSKVVVHSKPNWGVEYEIQELVFSTSKEAEEVSKVLGGEVVYIQEEDGIKMAA